MLKINLFLVSLAMFDKLASIEMRLMEIDSQLSRADLSGRELTKLTRERASIADWLHSLPVPHSQLPSPKAIIASQAGKKQPSTFRFVPSKSGAQTQGGFASA